MLPALFVTPTTKQNTTSFFRLRCLYSPRRWLSRCRPDKVASHLLHHMITCFVFSLSECTISCSSTTAPEPLC